MNNYDLTCMLQSRNLEYTYFNATSGRIAFPCLFGSMSICYLRPMGHFRRMQLPWSENMPFAHIFWSAFYSCSRSMRIVNIVWFIACSSDFQNAKTQTDRQRNDFGVNCFQRHVGWMLRVFAQRNYTFLVYWTDFLLTLNEPREAATMR